jgi:hypothetical protein
MGTVLSLNEHYGDYGARLTSFYFGIRPNSKYKKDVSEADSGPLCCVCSSISLIAWLQYVLICGIFQV